MITCVPYQDRLEKLKYDRIRARVAEIQEALEKRKQRDMLRMQAVESQFKTVIAVREALTKAARWKLQTTHHPEAKGVSRCSSSAQSP